MTQIKKVSNTWEYLVFWQLNQPKIVFLVLGIRNKLFSTIFFKEKTFDLIEATEAVEAIEANEVGNVVEVKKSLIV